MTDDASSLHVLIYEPRVEGHHLGYLKAISEDLLGAGYRLTLALDVRPEPFALIHTAMADVLPRVKVIAALDHDGEGAASPARVAACLTEAGADLVFLPNMDEIGSAMLRRAALGKLPPPMLRGRLGGIWHRPRFLGRLGLRLNQRLKAVGFRALLRGGWFSHLLLLDPFLHRDLKARIPSAPAFPLPDFFPDHFTADRAAARRDFALPQGRRVMLFYGGGYRRKGLSLAVEAMLSLDPSVPAFLFCAGRQPDDPQTAAGLERLSASGRARVINRYITMAEEKKVFAASDAVLLPYRNHFGISGVLIRAVGAGLPVIVSDENLIGRLTAEHGLGPLFKSGDVPALARAIDQVARASEPEIGRWGGPPAPRPPPPASPRSVVGARPRAPMRRFVRAVRFGRRCLRRSGRYRPPGDRYAGWFFIVC